MAEPNLRRSELSQTLHWPRLNDGRFAAWAGPARAKLRPGPRTDGRIGPRCSSGPAPSRRMRRRGKGRGPPRMRPQLGLGQWGTAEGVHEEKLEGTPASPGLQPSWLPHGAPTHPSDPSPVPKVAWGWGGTAERRLRPWEALGQANCFLHQKQALLHLGVPLRGAGASLKGQVRLRGTWPL